jgi:hypothetical protein
MAFLLLQIKLNKFRPALLRVFRHAMVGGMLSSLREWSRLHRSSRFLRRLVKMGKEHSNLSRIAATYE